MVHIRRSYLFSVLAALAMTGPLSRTALAQAEADRATARELASEGNEALKKQAYETAEDRFRRADALVHAPTLVVDHARALVGLGRLAEAYQRYQLVITEGVAPNAPRAWKQAVKEAEKEIQPLTAKIAWLTLSVKTPAEAHVWVDGRELSASELGARHPVDVGKRAVTARAEGFKPQEVSVSLAAGEDKALELELEPLPPKAEPAPEAPLPATIVVVEPAPRNRTWVYVAFGAGAAGLITGATTGVLALGVRSDIKAECGGLKCPPGEHFEAQKRKYDVLGTVSGVGFVIGVAGAATGTALLLMENRAEKAPANAARVVPYLGLGTVGVNGSF